jgi:hypothetical protein
MKVEVIVTYLQITEDLNLTPYQIINRTSSNKAVETMAKDLVERYDVKPDDENIEKVVITLTAKEVNIMDITRDYVLKQK